MAPSSTLLDRDVWTFTPLVRPPLLNLVSQAIRMDQLQEAIDFVQVWFSGGSRV